MAKPATSAMTKKPGSDMPILTPAALVALIWLGVISLIVWALA